jgi:polyphosphate kinase
VRVVSVIGRFLEHSRIYRFENNGYPDFFIGSADIMKRNLDGRIEVLAPVRSPEHQQQLDALIEMLLSDERQGWRLQDSRWGRDETSTALGSHAQLLAAAPFS